MEKLKDILKFSIKEKIKNEKNIAIALSGGMDSLSVLLCCLELNLNPTCYTFYLDNYESEDLLASRKICKIFNLELVEVKLDTSYIDLLGDVKHILKTHVNDEHCINHKKTFIQCFHPMTYLVKYVKESIILTAMVADDLQFNSKKFGILYSLSIKNNSYAVYEKRIKDTNNENKGSYKQIKNLFMENGINFIDVYRDKLLFDYFYSKTFEDCVSPKRKNLVYEEFKDYLVKYKLYRKPSPFQLNSKINEWHDSLLLDINYGKGFKSVVGIYNKIYKEIINEK
jgi:asparagine synthetase B (glutamine-hydrolysing)